MTNFLSIPLCRTGGTSGHRVQSDLRWELRQPLDYRKLPEGKGVYYDFSGKVWWLSPEEAMIVGHDHDPIFHCIPETGAFISGTRWKSFLFQK
jgi:hypothetical protein